MEREDGIEVKEAERIKWKTSGRRETDNSSIQSTYSQQ